MAMVAGSMPVSATVIVSQMARRGPNGLLMRPRSQGEPPPGRDEVLKTRPICGGGGNPLHRLSKVVVAGGDRNAEVVFRLRTEDAERAPVHRRHPVAIEKEQLEERRRG